MGSGWHEWPLMIFTVFGQCVVGGFIVLALALMKGAYVPTHSSASLPVCWACGC